MEHYKDLKTELAEIDNKLLALEQDANKPKKERKKALHEIFEMKKVKKTKKGTKH